jgi:glycosyltransferase involved in cell wall biosynthesis
MRTVSIARPVLRDEAWRDKYLELRHVAGIIVVSHAMKAVLTGFGIPAAMIHRIPCGADSSEFVARPDRSPRIRFLAVGRLTGKKGPIFLLDSFRQALERNPDIELNLVGDGELAEAVRQFVQAFSLTDRVKLHGVQPPAAVQELIRSSDVFVQHSVVNRSNGDEEGLPVSILEAMAGGLPVVSG